VEGEDIKRGFAERNEENGQQEDRFAPAKRQGYASVPGKAFAN
jgi:hypothetical protein